MRVLLHVCCGPCAVYPVKVLEDEGVEYEGFFYNPNIHPYEEFIRRKENVKKFFSTKDNNVFYNDDFQEELWLSCKGSSCERCQMCYYMRLEKTAKIAKERKFDAFTTTLLVSPYQNHEYIKTLSEKLAKEYEIEFLYRDFRTGFREGQTEARAIGLYRQKYCGCIISYDESQLSKHKKA